MGNDGGIGAPKYRLQFSSGSFRIGLDSALQFVVFDGGWSFTAIIFFGARIFCREAIEPAVDCPTRSSALTECVVDVSGRSSRIVVLAPLVVDDCSKWGFTYNNRQKMNEESNACIDTNNYAYPSTVSADNNGSTFIMTNKIIASQKVKERVTKKMKTKWQEFYHYDYDSNIQWRLANQKKLEHTKTAIVTTAVCARAAPSVAKALAQATTPVAKTGTIVAVSVAPAFAQTVKVVGDVAVPIAATVDSIRVLKSIGASIDEKNPSQFVKITVKVGAEWGGMYTGAAVGSGKLL
ncbi:hypothetical protein WR25_11486 [Diploscapter pachys]|uniref:Uncharacterized protein n=1 Tax=Diploscapter pachys TaxID=2018661 RepID=A0A2A2JPX5_9BILA|nr:hypothetical protein WR25_11486 [Diploscapter pachys]